MFPNKKPSQPEPIVLGPRGRYYVYLLMYPNVPEVFGRRAGTVFYVGKGTGTRVDQHERETRSLLGRNNLMKMRHKHKVILEIWDSGYQVMQMILGRTDDEEAAYMAESHYINLHGLARLTNATYGRRPKAKRTPRR